MQQSKKHDVAILALRLAAGVIFVLHGYGKLFGGMKMFTGMVAGLHFPAPTLFAYLAALSEFCGGIALILGIFPQVASFFIACVMLTAMIGVKKFSLPKADPDLALLAIAFAVGLMGAGRYSLQALLAKKQSPETVKAE